MDNSKVIEFLSSNEISDIEEIKFKEDTLALRFFYDFDDAEIEAAKAYANDESEDEEEGETWVEEFFIPYLNDLAVDNVGEVIEELTEKFGVDAQFISYEIDEEDFDYNEFIAVFFDKGKNIDIEDLLEQLEQ